MATNLTSLVLTESTIPVRRIRTHAGGLAVITIANLRCACSLVLNPPASSPYANLADPVRRTSEIIPHTQDSFNLPGRSDLRCIRKCGASPQCGWESALFH